MKRLFLLFSILYGFLTSLIVMALSYIGNLLLKLPFLPFDLFDWLTRHLPGSVIEKVIQSMVSVITALHLGPTSATAKLAEQIQALALIAAIGGVSGLLLGVIAVRERTYMMLSGLMGGVVLWLGMAWVEFSLPVEPAAGMFFSLAWLLVLLSAWGTGLAWLMERQAPQPIGMRIEGGPTDGSSQPSRNISRRNLLVTAGAGLVSAFVLVLGLAKIRSEDTSGSAPVTASTSSTPVPANPTPFAYGPDSTSGPAASPSASILNQRILPAPGTRPEIMPADEFYRIDINSRPPDVDANTWRLSLHGLVQNPLMLTLEDIRSRSAVTQAVTLSCISNPVGGDLISTNYWTGVRLKDILAEAGVSSQATGIMMMAVDEFYEWMPLEEAMDERTLLVYAMNGLPLTAEHGFPLRVFIPNHYGMKQPKWLIEMVLTSNPGVGYWARRGWSQTAIPETTSVIDTRNPKLNGVLPLGGIAYAGARGIHKVELKIDQADWVEAELRAPAVSPLTWVQWRYDWKNPQPGQHTLQVRAVDGAGELQTSNDSEPAPEGATGYHTLQINL